MAFGVKENIFQMRLTKLRQRSARRMIKQALIKYVRWWRPFKEWVNMMEKEGLEDLRRAILKENLRQAEIDRLREIELKRLREIEEQEEAARQAELDRLIQEELARFHEEEARLRELRE